MTSGRPLGLDSLLDSRIIVSTSEAGDCPLEDKKMDLLFISFLKELAVDGAFGSYSEATGGRLASLAYTPPPLLAALATPQHRKEKKNRKNISEKI